MLRIISSMDNISLGSPHFTQRTKPQYIHSAPDESLCHNLKFNASCVLDKLKRASIQILEMY